MVEMVEQPNLLTASCGYTTLEAVKADALVCTKCDLHKGRTHGVFSDGNPEAKLMFIGEGPGQTEDETGIPFVGRAGQLLTQIIQSVGLDRQKDTYICNIVKCRPPGNRAPEAQEMATCFPYLQAQINLIRPQIIVLAGATALKGALGIQSPISKIRGKWLDTPYHGAKAMAVFHPSYLLRNPQKTPGSPKAMMWDDIREIKRAYGAIQKGEDPFKN